MAETDVTSSTADEIAAAVRRVVGRVEGFVPLHEPEFRGQERRYVDDCVTSGWVSSVGSYVDRFERDLEDFTGVAKAVATSNGTSALHISLLLVGVERGDEVLIPSLTFVATANAVSYCGAVPHFVDSEVNDLGVDAGKLDDYLTTIATISGGVCRNRTTGAIIKALVVMHVFGHPCQLHALMDVVERWKLVLIEDAAESLGSYYEGRHTGNFGRIAALSFNGNKTITTGGGGAVLTNDPLLGARAKHLTTTARVSHKWNFFHDEVGYNYRMPNINAALGCAQMERLDDMLTRKRNLADRYRRAFASIESAEFLDESDGSKSNFWLNSIRLSPSHAHELDNVLELLNSCNLMARPLWTLMHRLPMYANCPRAELAVAEDLETRVISLPSSPGLVG